MHNEPIGNNEKKRNSVDASPINVSFPLCFHLNRVGNGKDYISSEEHFRNSETRRGTYLLLELFIFVQIFEFNSCPIPFKLRKMPITAGPLAFDLRGQ